MSIGSPLIAYLSMQNGSSLSFCDIDPMSLQSIQQDLITIPVVSTGERQQSTLELLQKDGISTIMQKITQWGSQEFSADVFVFIDPYDPFLKSTEGNITCIDVFCKAIQCGMKTALWYGFDSTIDRTRKQKDIIVVLKEKSIAADKIWWGDVYYDKIDHLSLNPGVQGGMLVGSSS
jgi:hypothetical protein